jgi:hypothetical protein
MQHGLIWLPLLIAFFWLAWSGWNEYQKVEAYRRWATQFERSKYDIYAVLGQKGTDLTWGKPTRQNPINLKTFSLNQVQSLHLLIDGKPIDLDVLPQKGRSIALEFKLLESSEPILIPFTEIPIAAEWAKYLQRELKKLLEETTQLN